MEVAMTLLYDPADRDVLRSPYELFARMRAEDPVHWSPKLSSWVVTSYAHVGTVLADSEFSSDRLTPFYKRSSNTEQSMLSEIMRYISLWMVFRDPPEHTRLRRLLNTAINPNIVNGMEPGIRSIVNLLLDKVETDDEFDFMADFAVQLPAMVIMDMMGIPRDMLFQIKGWSDNLINFVGSPRLVDNKYERARSGVVAMADYFRDLIQERRQNPQNDIMTMLIQARDDDESMLSDDELVASAMLLLFAGHETTTSLLGNAMMALNKNPDQMDLLRRQPELGQTAVEELLRYDGPALSVTRVVVEPHELGGKRLEKGNRVFAMIAGANRDPAMFENPESLNLARTPNRHIAFGRGPHFCLGAPLARLEAKIALTEILSRYPTIEMTRQPEELEWIDAMVMRGVKSLPIRATR
jgi:cytochrome P450